jgi:hypothetical protein
MRLRDWVCLLVVTMGLLLAATPAHSQVNTVNLSGTVLDPQNLAVANAKVTVKNLATGAERSVESDSNGRYEIVGLPPGRYSVTIEAKGFTKLVNTELVLNLGVPAEYNPHVSLQAGEQVVTVTSEAQLVETSRSAVAQTVDQIQIENLPINGRNYINFTLLNSQANRDSAPSIGAAPTSGLNFGGQRARSNEVSVDGADAVDNSVNGVRATVSQEAVQEFQEIISNYMPEYGRATGAVINIVTKSGSNETHGNVFGYFRHKNLQARNPYSVQVDPATGALIGVKQPYTRVQAGATIGGPIQKDKTFYFFSYETTRRQETGFTNIGTNTFNLVPLGFGTPFLVTQAQQVFIGTLLASPNANLRALGQAYAGVAGSASSVALAGIDPGVVSGAGPGARFPLPVPCVPNTLTPIPCPSGGQGLAPLPASFVNLNSLRGNFPIKEGTSLWSTRLDHYWNERNSSFVRVSVSPSLVTGIQVNAQNQNFGQNAGTRTSLQQTRDLAIVGQHDTAIRSNLFNEARFQFARRGLHYGFSQFPGGSNVGVNITGFAFFGREPFSTVDRIERRFQMTDNLSWIKGHHTFKTGVDINIIQLRSKKTQIFELNFGGLFNFGIIDPTPIFAANPATAPGLAALPPGTVIPSLNAVQAYGLGLPASFIQGIGTSDHPFGNKAFAGFVQDSWKVNSRLTLNYGVRYDAELTPIFPAANATIAAYENAFHVVEGIPRDFNNVAPRFALAWDPTGHGNTVVRAGYGLFFDHPLLAVAFNSFTAEGSQSVQLISAGGSPSALPFPTNPLVLNGGTIFQGVLNDPLNLTAYQASQQRFDPKNPASIFDNLRYVQNGIPLFILPFTLPVAQNFVYAYAQQGNLAIEQALGKDFKFSVSYSYTRGLHLNRPRDINSTNPLLLDNNLRNALVAGLSFSNPLTVAAPASNKAATAGTCGITVIAPRALGALSGCPGPLAALNGQFVSTAAFFNFFRPSGPNPSFAGLAGGFANQVALATLAGDPTNPPGFPGVQVPVGGVDNQESTGSSVYHGLTVNLSKRFSKHFEFLSSYTWSHAIDDSTDLQTLLEPQDSRFPNRERSNSTFDQRHRWVTSAVFQSPYSRSDSGAWRKFLADFTVSPIVEVASGRPFTVLTGTDFRLDLGANTGRPSVVSSGGITSPFIPGVQFGLPNVCDSGTPAALAAVGSGCTGNLGRNPFVRPGFYEWDLRLSRKFYLSERVNLQFIADAFNLFNRNNTADVSPLCDLSGGPGSTCSAGQPTAALDPRQFQFALKLNW